MIHDENTTDHLQPNDKWRCLDRDRFPFSFIVESTTKLDRPLRARIMKARWYTSHYNPKKIRAMHVEDEYGDHEVVCDAWDERLAELICEDHNAALGAGGER